jgi:predicted enzyme related to lactoylglutathione lyase
MSDRPKAGAVVYAKDVARVSAFYAAVLGVVDVGREDGYVVVETAEYQLVVVAVPAPIAQDVVLATPPARRTETALKFSFPVDSIARSRAAAAQHGGQIDAPEREWQFLDDLVCDGEDPEGNVVQVRERVR